MSYTAALGRSCEVSAIRGAVVVLPLRSEFASTTGFGGSDDTPFAFEDVLACVFDAEDPSLFDFAAALAA